MPEAKSRKERIEDALTEAFEPTELTVTDDSHKHKGHAGERPEGETHYSVDIVSEAFRGLSRVQVQRTIMILLQAEFDGGLHALQLSARAPPTGL